MSYFEKGSAWIVIEKADRGPKRVRAPDPQVVRGGYFRCMRQTVLLFSLRRGGINWTLNRRHDR
ncbi:MULTISPECIES: hypothetical protein [unclassified Variovorax]|uniref:hypothetical protein n=1 Tax=unclassified Variovorax TaxID=663243 RepID=UPI0013A58803|nr:MULTISPECIES: hypothetical protein [unclassified Variovorax]